MLVIISVILIWNLPDISSWFKRYFKRENLRDKLSVTPENYFITGKIPPYLDAIDIKEAYKPEWNKLTPIEKQIIIEKERKNSSKFDFILGLVIGVVILAPLLMIISQYLPESIPNN